MIFHNFDPRPRGIVIQAPVVRIVPEPEGGGLVITHRGHAWLYGDRLAAIEDKRWLDQQWRVAPGGWRR